MSQNDPPSERPKGWDMIPRGDYSATPVGKTTFFLARAVEPLLQYGILAHGLGTPILHRLGLRTLPPGLPAHTGIAAIDSLGLSPYRLVLLSMSIGSALKQNIWVSFLSAEPMPVDSAVKVGLFNAVFNSISSYAFLLSATSASKEADFPQPSLIVGGALYTVGILTELVAEIQRKRFKSDPNNKGKVYSGGLWQFARHINYGGYTLWRAGYALTGGGWALGAIVGAFFAFDFSKRAIPILNNYCENRYGEAWTKFKEQTPYRLIPFVY